MSRIFLAVGFIAHWVLIDRFLLSLSQEGLSTPWYPQAATSLTLLFFAFRSGKKEFARAFLLVAVAKFVSSIVVWPGEFLVRIPPALLFASAISLMAFACRNLSSPREGGLRRFAGALGWIVVIGLVNSTLRQGYFLALGGKIEGVGHLIFDNWVGDVASIICLAPALIGMIDLGGARLKSVLLEEFKERGALLGLVVLLVGASLCGVGELLHCAYLALVPAVAMMTLGGLPSALLVTAVANVGFGAVAVVHAGRLTAVELQVYFVSLNMMLFFSGAMVSERHRRFASIAETGRRAVQSQIAKIQVLVGLQQQALRPFADLLETLGTSKDACAIHENAREMLRRLDAFYQKIRDRVPGEGPLEPVEVVGIPEQIDGFVLDLFPADMSAPEVRIARHSETKILCVRENLHALLSRFVILLSQIGRDPRQAVNPSRILIRISTPDGTLRIDCEAECPSIPVESSDSGVLPPGGFALSIYVLKSLAMAMGGSFDLRPDYYDLKNKLDMQIRLPLVPEKGGA